MNKKQEPKYEARDSRIYNRASGEVIPDDEPIFVLRARDIHALKILDYYYNLCRNNDHAAAVHRRWDDFARFAIDHPERMKEPDTEAKP